MIEAIKFLSIQMVLLAVVLILHTYIGLHIIRRGLIFSDLALDQLAAFGTIIGISFGVGYASVSSYLLSLAAVLAGSFLLAFIKPKKGLISREAVIGILYALALTACLLAADKLSRGSDYVTKTLTGSMLWITWSLVTVTSLVYIVLLIFHYKYRKKFLALADKNKKIKNEKWWDFLFFSSQGIITVLIVPVAGVLLAYGFLMIPAAIAAMFTDSWLFAILLGWGIGFMACLAGMFVSYAFNFSYGPTLLLSLGMFFFAAIIIRAFCCGPSRKGAL